MQKMRTSLWFDTQAEEAAKFYTSIFKDSRMGETVYYTQASTGPSGKRVGEVLTVEFTLNGQEFVALNGGPEFKFNEAISVMVDCRDQEEVDYYWDKLTEGGEGVRCGWLKDKFGMFWQIVPTEQWEMLHDKDSEKVDRMMAAMQQMVKIDIQKLRDAFNGDEKAKEANS